MASRPRENPTSAAPATTYALIANPRSGITRRSRMRPLQDALHAAGIHYRPFHLSRHVSPADAARAAVREGATVLIAAGGDGTVSGVASVAVEFDLPLGILPAGTLNHFARDLKLPLGLRDAARVIAAGHVGTVDVAEVNGRVFLNNSSLGLYPRIAFWRERQRRLGRSRTLSLVWATLRALWRMPMVRVRVHATGVELRQTTPLVMIGNNSYHLSGSTAGTRASLKEGHLALYIANVRSRMGMLRLAVRTILGFRQDKDMEFLTVTEAWMETRKPQVRVALDGEVTLLKSPVHYRIRPGALRVLVP